MTISLIKKTLILSVLCNAITIKGSPEEINPPSDTFLAESAEEIQSPGRVVNPQIQSVSASHELMINLMTYAEWCQLPPDTDAATFKNINALKRSSNITQALNRGVSPLHQNPFQKHPNALNLALDSGNPGWAQKILAQDPHWANLSAIKYILAKNYPSGKKMYCSITSEIIQIFKTNNPHTQQIYIENCPEVNLLTKELLETSGITVVILD